MAKGTFWADFKAFAMKGNIVDMAVGVVVGGAFGKIISSLVDDILMPLVGWLIGGVDFTKLKVELKGTLANKVVEAADAVGDAVGELADETGGALDAVVDAAGEAVAAIPVDAAPVATDVVESIAASADQSVFLNYGNFIQQFVDFFIIALCIFLVIRGLSKFTAKKKKAEEEAAAAAAAAPAPKPEDVVLLEEIRDLLKNQK